MALIPNHQPLAIKKKLGRPPNFEVLEKKEVNSSPPLFFFPTHKVPSVIAWPKKIKTFFLSG